MGLRNRVFRGAAVLTAGQTLAQALGFARNIVIARMISPYDVGVATALAVTLSLVELVADVSIDKLLIQAADGEDPKLQAVSQAAMAVRGAAQAASVFLLSWPIAALFDLREAAWAFQCVAIGPLIRGFSHLDIVRLQRRLVFGPSVVREVVPQAVSLAAIWPLAAWLQDYRAVLFATLMQAGLYTACTHVGAERPYRWAWDRALLARIGRFGWPLLINGTLLFAINQGDRIAIGAAYSKEELAVWANAMLLASMPLTVFSRVAVSLSLPILSESRDDRARFARQYELYMQGLAAVGAAVAIPLILSGGAVPAVVFGPAYGSAGAYMGLIAAAQALRVLRIGPTVAALAHGETTNAAISNSARLLGLVGASAVAAWHGSLWLVALAALAGEAASFLVATARLSQKGILRPSQSIAPLAPLVLVLGSSGGLAWAGAVSSSTWAALCAGMLGGLAGFGVLLLCYARLRREPTLWVSGLRRSPA